MGIFADLDEQVPTGLEDIPAGESAQEESPREESPQAITAAVSAEESASEESASEESASEENMKNATRVLVKLPADLTNDKLVALAGELARDIRDEGTILSDYNLTVAHLDYLKQYNKFFRNALEASIQEWRSVKSTQERVKLHAAAILEDSLLHIGQRMQRPGENLNGVVEAGKLLAKVAGLDLPDPGKQGGIPGSRFNININIGAGQRLTHSSPVTIDAGPEGGASTGAAKVFEEL